MPYVEINGANIYYNAYGDDHPGRAPVILIHGSTIDSHTDWDSIAPELARHYRVFAPDCRGHGRSNNPCMSYSFKELAEDAAAFGGLLIAFKSKAHGLRDGLGGDGYGLGSRMLARGGSAGRRRVP